LELCKLDAGNVPIDDVSSGSQNENNESAPVRALSGSSGSSAWIGRQAREFARASIDNPFSKSSSARFPADCAA
jgi:hypothetical protein